MSNAQKAADEIINLANKFRSLFQAADSLASIGSLEQAAKDAMIRKDKAYSEAELADRELEKRKNVLANLNKQIDDVVLKGESLEESYKEKAKSILADANAKALDVARETADKKKSIDADLSALRGLIGSVKLELDAKNIELESITSQIKSMKEKILAFTR